MSKIVIYFQKGTEPRQYIKDLGKGFFQFTLSMDDAKAFRGRKVDWNNAKGPDYDNYNIATKLLSEYLQKECGHRVAMGREIFGDEIDQTVVIATKITETDLISTVLIEQKNDD